MRSKRYYQCERCGSKFETPVLEKEREDRGEFWGVPCFEEVVYAFCPDCGADEDWIEENMVSDDDEAYEEIISDLEFA